MNEREALREQLYGVNSHLHTLHALEGLDPGMAGTRGRSAPHTIFQILHHMSYWVDITLARLAGEEPTSPESASLGWAVPEAPEDESDWDGVIAGLAEGLRSLEALLVDPTFDLDRVADTRRGTTAREEVLMIQGHNSYHLGQIVFLRQELGSWPPPRGGDSW